MLHSFYLQIHKIKLQDYISKGIIVPDIYLGESAEKDAQSKNQLCLTLSKGYIKRLDEAQVLIEVILTDEEKESLHENGSIYYYDLPIPINRTKQIYVQDKQAKTNILKEIEIYESGYLPEKLFVYFKKGKKILFKECFETMNVEYKNSEDLKQKIVKYDKIMGMFAFMKNAHSYYFDERKTYANYSKNYFDVLSKFGSDPSEKSIDFFKVLKENRDFFDLVYSEDTMSDEFINSLIDTIEDEETISIFKDLLYKPNASRECLKRLKDKKEIYFYICLVYIHKQKDSNKKEYFKEDIAQEIPYEKIEYALAFLGLYYGYSDLSRSEEIQIDDTYMQKILRNNEINIKLKMDSKLDCVVIESIFNYVFHDDKNIQYDCSSHLFAKKQNLKMPLDKNFKIFYEVEKKDILGTPYFKIRKKPFEELVIKSLSNYKEEEISFDRYYLSVFVSINFKSLLSYSKDGKPVAPYFKKSNFLEIIKDEKNITMQNKLLKVFELDNR